MFHRRTFCQSILAGSLLPLISVVKAQADTRLILLGTQGGPNYNLNRGESASLLMIAGQPYLVDCGYGTLRAIIASGVDYLSVGHIFLSHLHDDHNADLPALLGHQWTQGRVRPTQVYGPFGTDTLVHAANLYNQANTDIRLVDEARTLTPSDLFSGIVSGADDVIRQVFENDHVRVSAIQNTHYPEDSLQHMPHRALSWRFDTDDRSVVFSGDTAYSQNLVNLARGADILVCEAMQIDVFRQSFEQMVAAGNYADNPEGIWNHIVGTHTTTEQAGRMAAEAGVGMLVLNHLIPGGLNELDDATYTEGVRRHYDGSIIIGKDQQVI